MWVKLRAVSELLDICWLGDGKAGHENQTRGLIEAMERLTPCRARRIGLEGAGNFLQALRTTREAAAGLPRPELVMGAGHRCHLPLLWLARRRGVPAVVIMKPSLPLACFDLCLAPRHDFPGEPAHPRLLLTVGAMNRVPPPDPDLARDRKLLLVGGPSKSHGWDSAAMLEALREVTAREPAARWRLTDSRRTPAETAAALAAGLPGVEIHPHAETTADWLPRQLSRADEVWVSEDSVSMVHEALSSGARVGLLPVPRQDPGARVVRGLDRLTEEGWVTPLEKWRASGLLAAPPRVLREADRCAAEILRRWFPERAD